MKNTFKSAPGHFVNLFLLIILLIPVKPLKAQQRSAYDLAAWIIAGVSTYDTANINWALKEGGQINFKRGGMNALEHAIYYKKTEMIKFLLRKGASIDSVNQDGMNALQYAERTGHAETIQLIRTQMKLKDPDPVPVKKIPTPIPVDNTPAQLNAYKVGNKVLHSRNRGKTWEPGTVKDILTTKTVSNYGLPPYLVENQTKTDQKYLDPNFITTFNRQPSWTTFFVSDWALNLPIASIERKFEGDVYRVFSGGERLPPLRINADGTYSWVIDKNKVIRGRWKQNDNAPGIWLLQGYRGANWFVYNTTDSNNRKIYKTDYIIISDEKDFYTANHGFRVAKGTK